MLNRLLYVMQKFSVILKKSGFGILEALVAVTLISLSMAALAQVLTSTLRGTQTIQAKSEFETLTNNLKMVLRDHAVCPNALLNKQVPPKPAYFHPMPIVPVIKQLNEIRSGSTVYAKRGESLSRLIITDLELSEIDAAARIADGPDRTRYLVALTVTAKRIGQGYNSDVMATTMDLYVTTDNSTHQIKDCGATTQNDTLLKKFDIRLELVHVPGCDANSSPPNECYCGGLETIHRATTTAMTTTPNATGSPYKHGTQSPYNTERPRAWVGVATCPAGYVAMVAGADCSVAGSGKLENILPLSPTQVRVSCCAYTSDSIPDGTVGVDKISLVCLRK